MASLELTGIDAFDNVLERLLTATSNADRERLERDGMRVHIHQLETQVKNLQTENVRLTAQINRDRKPLSELYAAAEAAHDVLRDISDARRAEPLTWDSPEATRLRKAMFEAQDSCEQIPF